MNIRINVEQAVQYMAKNFIIYGEAAQIARGAFEYWNDYASGTDASVEKYLIAVFHLLGFGKYHTDEMLKYRIITVED